MPKSDHLASSSSSSPPVPTSRGTRGGPRSIRAREADKAAATWSETVDEKPQAGLETGAGTVGTRVETVAIESEAGIATAAAAVGTGTVVAVWVIAPAEVQEGMHLRYGVVAPTSAGH